MNAQNIALRCRSNNRSYPRHLTADSAARGRRWSETGTPVAKLTPETRASLTGPATTCETIMGVTPTGNLIGYARVSTADQTADPQTDALTAAGCSRVFVEQASGALRDRPQLTACLDYLRAGDVLVVAKLDRLGRSLGHLIETVTALDAAGIGLRSLGEAIDTTTPAGRLLLHVLGAVAQFERDLIVDRTRAGLAAARARGRTGGRPPAMTPEKLDAARALLAAGRTGEQAAKAVGVSRATLYRHLGIATRAGTTDAA